jgi:hypothetical protein
MCNRWLRATIEGSACHEAAAMTAGLEVLDERGPKPAF